MDRIYSELGKFLSREFQDNMEVWEQQIEPTLGFSRDRLALCAAVLAQLSLAAIVLIIGAILFGREGEVGPPTVLGVLQAALGIVLVVRHLQPAAALCLLHADTRHLGAQVALAAAPLLLSWCCRWS